MIIKALSTKHEPRLQTPKRKVSTQHCTNSLHNSEMLIGGSRNCPKIQGSKVQPASPCIVGTIDSEQKQLSKG